MRAPPAYWLALAAPLLAHAGAQPGSGHSPDTSAVDARIRYIDYQPDHVAEIAVQRGTATRIVLAADEHILRDGAGTGFSADCAKPELEWCMRADPGSNQVLVRPKAGATGNNLELRTDKRDYSFHFSVLPDAAAPRQQRRQPVQQVKQGQLVQPAYRIMFRYSTDPANNGSNANNGSAAPPKPGAAQLIAAARPAPRNWQYSMQVMPGANDIVPALVFDDGRFTYLQFPANREMPTIYAIGAGDAEARVNFHIDPHDPGLLVVERMARRYVLRLGRAVVGLWNDAYDSYGSAPADGTTVEGVRRALRQEQP